MVRLEAGDAGKPHLMAWSKELGLVEPYMAADSVRPVVGGSPRLGVEECPCLCPAPAVAEKPQAGPRRVWERRVCSGGGGCRSVCCLCARLLAVTVLHSRHGDPGGPHSTGRNAH